MTNGWTHWLSPRSADTRSLTCSGVKGFRMYPFAPTERASTTRASLPSVVIMTTGTPLAASIVPQIAQKLDAVHGWHVDVTQDEIEVALLNFEPGLPRRCRLAGLP